MAMDQEVKQRWIEALESGEYEPGFGALRKIVDGRETHCCLGVLANLLEPEGWADGLEPHGDRAHRGQLSLIDNDLAETVGLSESDQAKLASVNDAVDEKIARAPGDPLVKPSYDRVIPYIRDNL